MSAQANYYKIGLFVVIAIVLTIGFVVVLGAGSLFQKTIIVETYINGSVQGLTVGSPVKFRGVPIGKVKGNQCSLLGLSNEIPVYSG